ncbi:MAG: hypothetical protein M3P23_01385 [Actinomycetota bacterium]|nr:hypothetical protein [Actinomycetota bacterium]
MRKLIVAFAFTATLAAASACGGSEGSADASGSTTSSSSSSSTTKPAHDLRIVTELEQYVTDEWNKAYADPAGANYAAGVTVKSVKCVPATGTTVSNCTITPSKGAAKRFGYIVADDGSSTERTEPRG